MECTFLDDEMSAEDAKVSKAYVESFVDSGFGLGGYLNRLDSSCFGDVMLPLAKAIAHTNCCHLHFSNLCLSSEAEATHQLCCGPLCMHNNNNNNINTLQVLQLIVLARYPLGVPSACMTASNKLIGGYVVMTCCAVHSCCPLMLSTHAVHSCCPLMLPTHAAHSCCPLMLSTHAAHSCCPLMLSTHAVHSCCPHMLSTHAHM